MHIIGGMILSISNKTYDFLKWIALIVLPALAIFWVAIASTWGLPYIQEIQTTIIAIDTFLGAILGISSNRYNKEGEADENK